MKIEKGKLKKVKNGFQVTVATKKGGTADLPIPEKARRFRPADAEDGTEVDVERDEKNRIVKVTIPGMQEAVPPPPPQQKFDRGGGRKPGPGKDGQRQPRGGGPRDSHSRGGGPPQPAAVRGLSKASARVLGLPFHNPYTFLPFAEKAPARHHPTALSADELDSEQERGRLTGIVELQVTTQSPLLTCHCDPVDDDHGHKTYQALKIGPDVIVPATGIRGSLRTLLTILTGGTLGYLNQHAYLCQGRDANLGPRGPHSPEHTPKEVFLAEVIRPGTAFRNGVVRLGQTRLVRLELLEKCFGRKLPRGHKARTLWVGLNSEGQPTAVGEKRSQQTPWKLKLSGRPINLRGKREGVFLGDGKPLELPADFWAAYSGRNGHGDRPELRKGDLVWLEPVDPNIERIGRPEDVASLQWARWGKRGQALKDKIPKHTLPDYFQDDSKVDEVTDLFGQVSSERGVKAPAFAARVRSENLVFRDAAAKVERVTLAPLAPPHPGCIAFYRDGDNPDEISEENALRGYKVYRATLERGEEAPWRFDAQGVYDNSGELREPHQKVNKTCDLVPEGSSGTVRLSFRGLTPRELALLLQACAVPWRLGGGKPLGLGLCRICVKRIIDENGNQMGVPNWTIVDGDEGLKIDGWQQEVQDIQDRVQMWIASQAPVPKLRYPRAVDANQFGKARGGHAWFQRHAKPRMVTQKGDAARQPGVEPLYIDGAIKEAAAAASEPLDPATPMIAGQILPPFDPQDPQADALYGYDAIGAETRDEYRPRRRVFLRVEPFDPEDRSHVTGEERSEGSHGKDAEFRKEQKRDRTKDDNADDGG